MFWRVFILVILGTWNVFLFSHVVWGPTGILEYRGLKRQYAALQDQIVKLDNENLALSKEIRLLETDSQYMEKMIRQRLHYVRNNEVLYLFDSKPETRSGAVNHDGKN